jgi:hypothetical protein
MGVQTELSQTTVHYMYDENFNLPHNTVVGSLVENVCLTSLFQWQFSWKRQTNIMWLFLACVCVCVSLEHTLSAISITENT